jgi:predicted RNA-binding Zn-ribbon protein involved in translation (DUF1610 family)
MMEKPETVCGWCLSRCSTVDTLNRMDGPPIGKSSLAARERVEQNTMGTQADYAKSWSDHRADLKVLGSLVVLFFPVLYLVVKPLYLAYHFEWLVSAFACGWALFMLFFMRRVHKFKCPQCGQRYFYRRGSGAFQAYKSKHCVHCGFKKYAVKAEPEGDRPVIEV